MTPRCIGNVKIKINNINRIKKPMIKNEKRIALITILLLLEIQIKKN